MLQMLLTCSHLVVATEDVPRISGFFAEAFASSARFANDMFAEFVLPSGFRLAFFKPTGPSARTFDAHADRSACAIGLTVSDVEACYRQMTTLAARFGIQLSGPPKSHPWGETSFLLTDVDGNRWEITQTPSPDGMLTER